MKLLQKSRRRLVRIISYALAVVLALAGGVTAAGLTAARYRTQLEYTYERGLSELAEHLNAIDTTLTKGIYTGTAAGASRLAMNLWSEAGAAKACLSQIPSYGSDLENTYKFLSQVGEYALSLAKKMLHGDTLTDEEQNNLLQLAGNAKALRAKVNDLWDEMNQDGRWKKQIESVVEGNDAQTAEDSLYTGLKNMEESLQGFPTLLYDGPFSEHILQAEPLLIRDLAQVKEATARATAARALNTDPQTLGEAAVTEQGAIPSYVYYQEEATAAVTLQGGVLHYFDRPREVGDTALQYDECVQIARDYLAQTGLGPFQESYYTVSEGICLINFAYLLGDIVCYPDLVKVGVALDNGEIVSYNAQGYIMNHTDRTVGIPAYSPEQAQAVLSAYLTVHSRSQAIIPLPSRETQLCYEFLCSGQDEDEILVYVNAATLEEEQILLVLKTDGGTLTL